MSDTFREEAAKKIISYIMNIGAILLSSQGIKLKSGRISPYFFESALLKTGDIISKFAEACVEAIPAEIRPDVIFCPSEKGVALATAITLNIGRVGLAYSNENGAIIGAPLKDQKVLIFDDVMTTGVASTEAFELIKEDGGIPIACLVACDRQERAQDTETSASQHFQEKYNIPVFATFTLADLISHLEDILKDVFEDQILNDIKTYKKEYGAG